MCDEGDLLEGGIDGCTGKRGNKMTLKEPLKNIHSEIKKIIKKKFI